LVPLRFSQQNLVAAQIAKMLRLFQHIPTKGIQARYSIQESMCSNLGKYRAHQNAAGYVASSMTASSQKRRFVTATSSPIKDCSVHEAKVCEEGNIVQLGFTDGSTFDFHGLWLRDACRDAAVLSEIAGERYLERIPPTVGCTGKAKSVNITAGNLEVVFDDDHEEVEGKPLMFPGAFLRMYGPIVGRPCGGDTSEAHPESEKFAWLEPYSGYDKVPAPDPSSKKMWKNAGVPLDSGRDQFHHVDYESVVASDAATLEMLQVLMKHGVVIIDNVPEAKDGSVVRSFADECLGGMQKDPARADPNWVIQRKESAVSVSYAQTNRLNNHTDQSVPAHGIPALLLAVHYVSGQGVNTLVDGYAAAQALRERDPAAFHMLSSYGNCQERDFIRSRVDSVQEGTQSMLISTKQPIIQLDDNGDVIRVQFNEVFRTPSTVSFKDFPEWYRAYGMWTQMINGPEFEVEVPINEGHILLIDNWRVLHGRAGKHCSPNRCIMGGTVVREAFHSKAIQLMGANYPVADYGTI
jgi:alpha-ketoglutarate-dependent taurine dioxygenase